MTIPRPTPALSLFLCTVASAQGLRDRELPPALPLERGFHEELVSWRSIGPANMGGRIVALAVAEGDPSTYWAATASGGVLATRNRGLTYEHQFQHEGSISIGHLAVAPSDPRVLWLGTGEANPRNSVSYGDGVYRSEDGGASWKHMGLADSFQIGRIAIHPQDPDTVYVGALGRLWGPSEERGLFKTIDGGRTWERVLFVDEHTGVIDVDLHPTDPDVLLVATYQRERDDYDTNDPSRKFGPGSGLWRSQDAGLTWERIHEGLPAVDLGRIGVDWHRSDPSIVYAVVESERIGQLPEDTAWIGLSSEKADVGLRVQRVTQGSPAESAGLEKDDIVLRMDGQVLTGQEDLARRLRDLHAGDRVRLEYVRGAETFYADVVLGRMPGDESERRAFGMFLGGQDPNVQEDQGRGAVDTGGVYRSADGGLSWERVNSLNPRPMYFSQIRVDPSDPEYVYVLGIALYRSEDGGRTFTADGHGPEVHVDHHALWIDPADGRHMVLGNDGGIYVTHDRMESWDHHNHVAIGQFYHVSVDDRDPYHVYGGLQDNGTWGGPSRVPGRGLQNHDWISVGGGDGFLTQVDPVDPELVYYESQNGGMGRVHLASGERALIQMLGGENRRFHWKTPFALSHHAPRVFYAAGDRLYRSLDQGSRLAPISPELSRTPSGTATAFSESPEDPDLLYVGTEDGAIWRSTSFGRDWTCLHGQPEDPAPWSTPFGLFRALALGMAGGEGLDRAAVGAELGAWFDAGDEDGDGTLDGEELEQLIAWTAEDPRLWRVSRPVDPWLGTWRGEFESGADEDRREFELELGRDVEGRIVARFESDHLGEGSLDEVTWSLEEGLRGRFPGVRGDLHLRGRLEGGKLVGQALAAGGLVVLPFEAESKERRSRRGRGDKETEGGKPLGEWLERPLHVASIEASRHSKTRVYLALDAHRQDDDRPWIFWSEDSGNTWRPLHDQLRRILPRGSARVLREDRVNPDLLYLGTEFGAFASLDRGQNWFRLGELPHVAVHEFAQPRTAQELVAGTHGRSLWIADVSALRGLTPEQAGEEVALLPVRRAEPRSGRTLPHGDTIRRFEGEEPPEGTEIVFLLRRRGDVRLTVEAPDGELLCEFEDVPRSEGLHRVPWDLRRTRRNREDELRPAGRVEPGRYVVVLEVDGERHEQPVEVAAD